MKYAQTEHMSPVRTSMVGQARPRAVRRFFFRDCNGMPKILQAPVAYENQYDFCGIDIIARLPVKGGTRSSFRSRPGLSGTSVPPKRGDRHESVTPAISAGSRGCVSRAYLINDRVGTDVSNAACACDRSLRGRRASGHVGAPHHTKTV